MTYKYISQLSSQWLEKKIQEKYEIRKKILITRQPIFYNSDTTRNVHGFPFQFLKWIYPWKFLEAQNQPIRKYCKNSAKKIDENVRKQPVQENNFQPNEYL